MVGVCGKIERGLMSLVDAHDLYAEFEGLLEGLPGEGRAAAGMASTVRGSAASAAGLSQ